MFCGHLDVIKEDRQRAPRHGPEADEQNPMVEFQHEESTGGKSADEVWSAAGVSWHR